MLPYTLTILISAFMLFQVEPIIAKIVLPWFGGSATVWSICLLFFQVVLLLDYLYAYRLIRRFGARVQARIHIALLPASLLGLADSSRGAVEAYGNRRPYVQHPGAVGGPGWICVRK